MMNPPMIYFAAAVALLLSATGCGKVYNSSTYDSKTYGSSTGTPQFLAAKAVIVSRCANCHTHESHTAWAGISEQEFVSQGLVIPGDLSGSILYTNIQGNRSGLDGSMPKSAAPLSDADLTTMELWIQSISP